LLFAVAFRFPLSASIPRETAVVEFCSLFVRAFLHATESTE
jgi:hypothetical protein